MISNPFAELFFSVAGPLTSIPFSVFFIHFPFLVNFIWRQWSCPCGFLTFFRSTSSRYVLSHIYDCGPIVLLRVFWGNSFIALLMVKLYYNLHGPYMDPISLWLNPFKAGIDDADEVRTRRNLIVSFCSTKFGFFVLRIVLNMRFENCRRIKHDIICLRGYQVPFVKVW